MTSKRKTKKLIQERTLQERREAAWEALRTAQRGFVTSGRGSGEKAVLDAAKANGSGLIS